MTVPHESPEWRRSSLCVNAGCVEIGTVGGQVLVRDSKLAASPVLTYTRDEWRAFLAGVKAGEFDDVGADD